MLQVYLEAGADSSISGWEELELLQEPLGAAKRAAAVGAPDYQREFKGNRDDTEDSIVIIIKSDFCRISQSFSAIEGFSSWIHLTHNYPNQQQLQMARLVDISVN